MESFKCKSCNGKLEKSGFVYVCENCGEVFKETEIEANKETNNKTPEEIVKELLKEGKQPIELIKEVRNRTGMSLQEAKRTVDFVIASSPNTSNGTQQTGGCFIATCVYGSYDCPEVWVLRRYRDYQLAKTWYGKCFINFYYAISPKLVEWFGNTQWFKDMFKGKLDKMVNNLMKNGYTNEQYIDYRR